MYYLQSRYYDPEIGRFISPASTKYLDPETLGELNLYTYCLNNPIMNIDPSDHSVVALLIFLVATTIAGGVIGGVTAYTDGARGVDLAKSIFLGSMLG